MEMYICHAQWNGKELFSENTENAVKMIDFIEIYGKIKTCRVIDK